MADRTRALCQNCLRLHLLCDLIPDANAPPGLCPTCGGQCCSCGGCLGSVEALAARQWDAFPWQDAGMADRAISWTPDGGLVAR